VAGVKIDHGKVILKRSRFEKKPFRKETVLRRNRFEKKPF
jgi:hypothetical protein